ncbi:dolichol kinase sec59 [Parachaetomium inaequale]|uniref:dolichol kinase n=1 Tax=Parachaetomium inaequale TaxID=2588326 RepID=A0AAN6PPU3_9PEZI|nr:dolichol kinase sec59 [Parachaetomium inaequale]
MPEHLQPPPAPTGPGSSDEDHDRLGIRARSPHPYHRLNSELLEPADRITYRASTAGDDIDQDSSSLPSHPFPSFARDSPPTSESGTEADDEHFLKGLPAPKARSHKGLRGRNEQLSGASTPLLSPAVLEEEGRKTHPSPSHGGYERDKRGAAERARRRKELIRRATELLLLVCQGGMAASNPEVQPFLRLYQKELLTVGGIFCGLIAAYPVRLVAWAYRQGQPRKLVPFHVPAAFDPAPILYPPSVPVLVSLLIAQNVKGAVLPSLVLSICALPRPLIPGARDWEYLSCVHWLLSCIPFVLGTLDPTKQPLGEDEIPPEILVLLYPLHQTLCLVLHHLTTTSLLASELQLLSAALISLLLLASSPQAVILKAVLWGGGLGLAVFCSQVIQWGISLARVPKWRFRRATPSARSESGYQLLRQLLPFQRPRSGSRTSCGSAVSDTDHSMDEFVDGAVVSHTKKIQADSLSDAELMPATLASLTTVQSNPAEPSQSPARRHTLPTTGKPPLRPKATTTPSGRRKRAASSSVRAFFSLTQTQATIRKWLYASYVYLCILLVILVGIRLYVQHHALAGHEPIGWALAYLLGDIPQFRFHVVKANLERWIPLPPLLSTTTTTYCHPSDGWAQRARLASLGPSTTRLFLSAYWLLTILTGLAIVLRLSPVYEVDTRRKVFHFMMVAMFLPTTYIDPCYVALALALMLAIFLVLDLLRASQLPPLSRPIARFLTPYVDGRDLRGPVVVSHIFLLVGCAIPLWLSLAALPRSTEGATGGWEVPWREVSMVSGVVCVGLGDAAASLVGRRWGVRKWLWGGGKSVEGSVAFAGAVFAGLMGAAVWLRLGGWAVTSASSSGGDMGGGGSGSGMDSLMSVLDWGRLSPWLRGEVPKAAVCASLASLTEAVLTGGNDNVVVPVVLWGCVKSLGV